MLSPNSYTCRNYYVVHLEPFIVYDEFPYFGTTLFLPPTDTRVAERLVELWAGTPAKEREAKNNDDRRIMEMLRCVDEAPV
jgi:hypothetical protein